VILGKQPLAPPALSGDLETFMSWVDEVRQLKVMANADTPEAAAGGGVEDPYGEDRATEELPVTPWAYSVAR